MRKPKHFVMVSTLIALSALIAPSFVFADEWDKATKMTFNEPVEIPGRVLEPGTYWFTLADSQSDRNIVQIWNENRNQLVATILAIPDYRLQPADKTIMTFEERPSGSPEAIHAWFYPGDNFGQEFVYPKKRATQLAQQISKPVLSIPDEQQPTKQAPVKAINPSGEEIEIAEVIATQPAPMPQAPQPSTLPQTASNLPLIALLGIISLAGAVGLRFAHKSAE